MDKSSKFAFYIGIIGPIYYFVLLTILGWLWEGYSPVSQSMSEIGAVDSPYRHYMNFLGFSLLGIVIIIFAWGYYKEFDNSIFKTVSVISTIIAGVFMFIVGFLPCDAGCVDVTLVGKWHSYTSMIPAIFLPLAAMASAQVLTLQKNWGQKWGSIAFFLGLFSMASGPIMFLPNTDVILGIVQRAGIGLSLVWILFVSLRSVLILSKSPIDQYD